MAWLLTWLRGSPNPLWRHLPHFPYEPVSAMGSPERETVSRAESQGRGAGGGLSLYPSPVHSKLQAFTKDGWGKEQLDAGQTGRDRVFVPAGF